MSDFDSGLHSIIEENRHQNSGKMSMGDIAQIAAIYAASHHTEHPHQHNAPKLNLSSLKKTYGVATKDMSAPVQQILMNRGHDDSQEIQKTITRDMELFDKMINGASDALKSFTKNTNTASDATTKNTKETKLSDGMKNALPKPKTAFGKGLIEGMIDRHGDTGKATSFTQRLGRAVGTVMGHNDLTPEEQEHYARKHIFNQKRYDRAMKGGTDLDADELREIDRHMATKPELGGLSESEYRDKIGKELLHVNNRAAVKQIDFTKLDEFDSTHKANLNKEGASKRDAELSRALDDTHDLLPHEQEHFDTISKKIDTGDIEVPMGVSKEQYLKHEQSKFIANKNVEVLSHFNKMSSDAAKITGVDNNKETEITRALHGGTELLPHEMEQYHKEKSAYVSGDKVLPRGASVDDMMKDWKKSFVLAKNVKTQDFLNKRDEQELASPVAKTVARVKEQPKVGSSTTTPIKTEGTPLKSSLAASQSDIKMDGNLDKASIKTVTIESATIKAADIQPKEGSSGGGGDGDIGPSLLSTAADVAGDLAGAGKKGGGILSKLGKGAKMLGKVAGPLAIATSLYDGVSGYNNANENLGIEGREATFGEKMSSAAGGVVSGLSFGLLDEKSTSKGIASLFGAGPYKLDTKVSAINQDAISEKQLLSLDNENKTLKAVSDQSVASPQSTVQVNNSTVVQGGSKPVPMMPPAGVRPTHNAFERFVDRVFTAV